MQSDYILRASASRAPPRGDGGQRSNPAKSLDALDAVMAGALKRITRQGLGIPESAAGQGEKAGPQSSLSTDHSSTLVGDLANVEYNTTRRSHNPSHDCDSNRDVFCYICCKYEVSSLRKKIDDDIATPKT